ncbi:RagB/SusD family nutrient uptake outer membrane protein [Pedobacter sp. Du54]|uniref:RagB/SusD family nutrient uptake outer membrane protein n=1 Tax=Pedobacter anseongensis TaxID=3133439 RepID=UPI0030A8D4CE
MKNIFYVILSICVISISCKKDWLEKKYSISQVVPTTIEDLQKLLDNEGKMNTNYPGLGLVGSDNYFTLTSDWQSQAVIPRNAYIWSKDILEGGTSNDWNFSYEKIEICNVVLEGLNKIKINEQNAVQYSEVKGAALFHRAFAFYNLVQNFAKQYSTNTKNDLGIPLRLSADVNIISKRNSIEEVYSQVIKDLNEAEGLLPARALFLSRPSKSACQALLSRIYLCMGDFDNCIASSTKVLGSNNSLLDFNTLSTTAPLPFPNFKTGNSEIVFFANISTSQIIRPYTGKGWIDSVIYKSYQNNDLRKILFYRIISEPANQVVFRGAYSGTTDLFGGLAINEVYLNRAESYARINKFQDASADLNSLLRKRYKTGSYVDINLNNATEALEKILLERRKELPFTGQIRWEDLRRLNTDPRFQKTLVRTINNQTYTLTANDARYVYQIPDVEIRLSGIEQNIR